MCSEGDGTAVQSLEISVEMVAGQTDIVAWYHNSGTTKKEMRKTNLQSHASVVECSRHKYDPSSS